MGVLHFSFFVCVSRVFFNFFSLFRVCVRVSGVVHDLNLCDPAQLRPAQEYLHLYHGVFAVGGAAVEKQPGFPRRGQGAACIAVHLPPPLPSPNL